MDDARRGRPIRGYVLLCDRSDRLLQPCQIGDLAGIPPELDADRTQVFESFVQVLEDVDLHVVTLHGSRRVPPMEAAA